MIIIYKIQMQVKIDNEGMSYDLKDFVSISFIS